MSERPNNEHPWWHPDRRTGDSLRTLSIPQMVGAFAIAGLIGLGATVFFENTFVPSEKTITRMRAPEGSERRASAQYTLGELEKLYADLDRRSLKALEHLNAITTKMTVTNVDLDKIRDLASKDQGHSLQGVDTNGLSPELQGLVKELQTFNAQIEKIREEAKQVQPAAENMLSAYLSLPTPGNATPVTDEEKRQRLDSLAAELQAQSKNNVSASPNVSELIRDTYKGLGFSEIPVP